MRLAFLRLALPAKLAPTGLFEHPQDGGRSAGGLTLRRVSAPERYVHRLFHRSSPGLGPEGV